MKRIALAVLLVLVLANAAHSEALLVLLFGDKLSTERFQPGINAAVTGGNLMGLDGTKARYSWAFGMFGDIKVSEVFRIQPELTVKTPAGATNRPAVHAGDGPVSYVLEYKGIRFVFGAETFPNKWFLKYAKKADFVIHECMPTPEQMVMFYNQPPPLAWRAGREAPPTQEIH